MTYQLYAHEPGTTDARPIGRPNTKSATTTRVRQLIGKFRKDSDGPAWRFTRTDEQGRTEEYDRATGTWKPQRS